ncbi:hypothetical protein LINPERPRIM_LOCUS4805, partial [Linum perenne]
IVYKCLVDWDVERKIWSISLDNAAYNDSVLRQLKNTLTYTIDFHLMESCFMSDVVLILFIQWCNKDLRKLRRPLKMYYHVP